MITITISMVILYIYIYLEKDAKIFDCPFNTHVQK